MGLKESAAYTASVARKRAAAKTGGPGARKARGRKKYTTGRPSPTKQANAAAEKKILRMSGKPGGATVTRNRAAEARAKYVASKAKTKTAPRKRTPTKTATRTTTVTSGARRTGSNARTRSVTRTAKKVAARSGMSKSASRKKARSIVKARK